MRPMGFFLAQRLGLSIRATVNIYLVSSLNTIWMDCILFNIQLMDLNSQNIKASSGAAHIRRAKNTEAARTMCVY